VFGRILAAAALAGLLCGLLLTAIQQIAIVPLILEAEAREHAAAEVKPGNGHASGVGTFEAWAPRTPTERMLSTALANVIAATGFALLLAAAMAMRHSAGWRVGLLWGVAGFAVFFVAPSLGVPPELPGSDSAPLRDRQWWWIAAVVATAAGLWLVALSGRMLLRCAGAVLLVIPHMIGAPIPPSHDPVPWAASGQTLVQAVYVANGVFWLALGGLLGFLLRRKD
jgi:cobalt transporter subunit CbtA